MNELNLNLVWVVVEDLNLNSLEKGHLGQLVERLGQLVERFEELQLCEDPYSEDFVSQHPARP